MRAMVTGAAIVIYAGVTGDPGDMATITRHDPRIYVFLGALVLLPVGIACLVDWALRRRGK